MINLLIGVSIVLLVFVLVLLFRTQILLSIMKGSYGKSDGSSNRVNGIIFILFFVFLFGMFAYLSMYETYGFLPDAASEHGKITDELFWLDMGIIIVPLILTHILLFSFPFLYSYKKDRKAKFYPENHKLEFLWTIVPAIVLTVLVITGWMTWTDITREAPKESIQIEVMAKQFAWQVRYAGKDGELGKYDFRNIDAINEFGLDVKDKAALDDFMPREIHIPKGVPVNLNIRSRDVLHSVFLPHFRVKMDAVPGMPTKFWFTPTKTTQEMRDDLNNPEFNYELACTEVCGRGHFAMKFLLVVDEEEDYEKWYAENAEENSWLKLNPDYLKSVQTEVANAASIESQELTSLK